MDGNCSFDADVSITGEPVNIQSNNQPVTVDYADSTVVTCQGGVQLFRTWTLTDSKGLFTTHVQVVTVQDTQVPVWDQDMPLDETVSCSAVPLPDLSFTATDQCDPAASVQFTETRINGNCPDNYTLSRQWVATDDCGNALTHIQTLTVTDTQAPFWNQAMPANTTVSCDAVPGPLSPVTASDLCAPAVGVVFAQTSTQDPNPQVCGHMNYTLTRTWVATDACGNALTHTQVLQVADTQAPSLLNVPANVTVPCLTIPPLAVVTATDNCSSGIAVNFTQTSTQNPDPSTCGNQTYTISRTWSAVDLCGNNTARTQVISVVDDQAPTLLGVPADITVSCDQIPAPVVVTATDICDSDVPVTFMESVVPGNCPNNYALIRTWTGTDNCGNSTTGVQVVTVVDQTPPVALCSNYTAELGPNGQVQVLILLVDNGSYDNCGLKELSVSPAVLTCAMVGQQVVTLTATDQCGNTHSCASVVTVVDNSPPIMACKDVTIELDAAGQGVTIGPNEVSNGITDNCAVTSVVLSQQSFGCDHLGINTIQVTATDPSGNASSCPVKVRVVDLHPPIFVSVPEDFTVYCNAPLPGDPPVATDNCGEVLVSLFDELTEPIANGVAGSYLLTRVWMATDKAGLFTTHVQAITVLPGGNTLMYCSDDITTVAVQAPIAVTWSAPQVLDACDGQIQMTLIDGLAPGSYFNPGSVTRITYEYVDYAGVRYQCAFNVIVPTLATDYLVVINQEVTCDERLVGRCAVENLPVSGLFSFEWIPTGSMNPVEYQLSAAGSLELYADGTARLTGTWVQPGSGDGWNGSIRFKHRRTFQGWTAIGGVANNFSGLGNAQDWDFFELEEDGSRLTGTGNNAGLVLDLRIPQNYPGFGFQTGVGANVQTSGNGGWFAAVTVPEGEQQSNGLALFSFALSCNPTDLVKEGAEVISLDGFDYQVLWSNGVSGPLLGDVAAGMYNVQVTGASGQTNSHTFRLVQAQDCILYWENACREANVAVGAQAVQSSTAQQAVAGRAVDGRTDGDLANGSLSRTLAGGFNYWQVRLDEPANISAIRIWPRTDCCADLLDAYYVFVSENPFPVGVEIQQLLTDPSVLAIYHEGPMTEAWQTAIGRKGQYVRIQVVTGDQLELADVEVLVCQPDRLIPGSAFKGDTDTQAGREGNARPEPSLVVSTWPNPAGEELTLTLEMEEARPARLVVLHSSGLPLYMREVQAERWHDLKVDVSGWAPGLYFITVYTADGVSSTPLYIHR